MTDAGIVTDRLIWQAVLAMAGFSQLWIVVLLLTILGCSEIIAGQSFWFLSLLSLQLVSKIVIPS